MAEIILEPVTYSETVDGVAYFPELRDLIVHFKSGGSYVYHNCPPELYERFHKRHPWRRIHADVKALPTERLSKGLTVIRELR